MGIGEPVEKLHSSSNLLLCRDNSDKPTSPARNFMSEKAVNLA